MKRVVMVKREIGIVIISILSVASIEAMKREKVKKMGEQYPLHKKIQSNSRVKSLIVKYKNIINYFDNNGETLMHYLVFSGLTIDSLCTIGSSPNVHNKFGFTPLDYAVSCEYIETAKKLLERGANANGVCIHPKKGSNLMKLLKIYGYTGDQEKSLFIAKGIVPKHCMRKLENNTIEREKSS